MARLGDELTCKLDPTQGDKGLGKEVGGKGQETIVGAPTLHLFGLMHTDRHRCFNVSTLALCCHGSSFSNISFLLIYPQQNRLHCS
jgi:hypothetical protein